MAFYNFNTFLVYLAGLSEIDLDTLQANSALLLMALSPAGERARFDSSLAASCIKSIDGVFYAKIG